MTEPVPFPRRDTETPSARAQRLSEEANAAAYAVAVEWVAALRHATDLGASVRDLDALPAGTREAARRITRTLEAELLGLGRLRSQP